MVIVRTNVDEAVYARLLNDEEVEAITNFDKIGFQRTISVLERVVRIRQLLLWFRSRV